MKLNFLQSNWLRQYPFQAGHGDLDLLNNHMPSDLIIALRITCDNSNLNVYINRVTTDQGVVSLSFCGDTGPLGFANGVINTSNQSLLINNFKGGVIGNVIIGNAANTIAPQTYLFDASNGLVEASTILVLPKPAVSSFAIKMQNVVGAVTLTSKTLNITVDTEVNLAVIYPDSVTARGDLSAETLSCGNMVIGGINSVQPDRFNNIDIYAIAPLKISTTSIDGILQLQLTTPDLDYNNLCKAYNIPPTDAQQTSHEPIATIENPEWNYWTQFL